jgi:hypothetical protein
MNIYLADTSDGRRGIKIEGKDRKDAIKNYNNDLEGYQKHGKLLKVERYFIEHITVKKKHRKL